MVLHRVASSMIIFTSSRRGSSGGSSLRMISEKSKIVPRGLLISWATPAASCPTEASFSDWINCCSVVRRVSTMLLKDCARVVSSPVPSTGTVTVRSP